MDGLTYRGRYSDGARWSSIALDRPARYLSGMAEGMNSSSARREHLVDLDRPEAYRSTFEKLLLTFLDLAPRRDTIGTRDGRRAAMIRALDCRATYYQIRDWRQGYRAAPQWAWDLLDAKLAQRQEAIAIARSQRKTPT
jgi:hypothetical protein